MLKSGGNSKNDKRKARWENDKWKILKKNREYIYTRKTDFMHTELPEDAGD